MKSEKWILSALLLLGLGADGSRAAESARWIRFQVPVRVFSPTFLAAQRGVRYLSAVSGPSDLVCEVVLPSLDDLLGFSVAVIGGHPGVVGSSVSHQLLTVKRGYVLYPSSLSSLSVA